MHRLSNALVARTAFAAAALLITVPLSSAATPAIPDFSGIWGRNWFFFEPKPGGPAPVTNKNRFDSSVVMIADDSNPILTPQAATALRKRARIAAQSAAPDPHNQCQPEPTPFILNASSAIEVIQQKDEVLLIHVPDQKVRHVHMNVPHAAHLVPRWQGESVGHYEGDTLVVDTTGQKVGPLSMVDMYGTPFSEKLHVVERYRLIDGAAARDAQQQHDARYFPPGVASPLTNEYGRGSLDPDTGKPGLQVEVTVEDPETFTTPWSALITYRHVQGDWPEAICAENTREYYANRDTAIPRADKPDF